MKKSNPNVCNVSLHECILHCWNRLGMEIAVDVELKLITPKLHCVAKSLALKFFANAHILLQNGSVNNYISRVFTPNVFAAANACRLLVIVASQTKEDAEK